MRRPARTWLTLLCVLTALSMGWPGAIVSASEPQGGPEDANLVRQEQDWSPGNAGMALWFWPEGRRVYQLHNPGVSFDTLKSYDANTLEPVETVTLDPPAWGVPYHSEYTSGTGRHHVATVDREQGRLFVAYRSVVAENGGPALFTPTVTRGEVCTGSGTLADPGCVGGLHVLDGESLESLGRIPLSAPTAEGPRLQPIPRSLEYAPPAPSMGWGGRVLMVVEEIANGPTENSIVPALVAATQNAVPRRNSGNIAYAIAFDPDTMRQEWAVRLEGCRNSREERNWMKAPEGHPSTIFRVAGDDPAVYVGCHGNPSAQGVVVKVPLDADGFPASLPAEVADPSDALAGAEPSPETLVAPAPRQEVSVGPDNVTVILSDPVSRRILMRVNDAGEVWWVFDSDAGQFIGTIGIGDYNHGHSTFGLDNDTGRLYVLAAKATDTTGPGGLYVADTRRNPVPQALHYPEFADPPRTGVGLNTGGGATDVGRTMSVEPRGKNGTTRLFHTRQATNGQTFRVLVDTSAVSVDGTLDDSGVVRTLDLDEAVGVTQATFDGAARGFGFRTILIGGLEAAARVGPADPIGMVRGTREFESRDNLALVGRPQELVGAVMRPLPPPDPCSDAQRELIVAFVGPRGPAVVDASSARGEAQPVLADVRTQEDVEQPMTRCAPDDWEGLWEKALVSRPPMEEPGVAWPFTDGTSSCTATEEEQHDSWSDPVVGAFSSRVECGEDQVGGWGQARGVDLDGVSVADALSSFRIYRDAERGMVARVESIARGVNIGGVVKIDTIRGVAESWANGRQASDLDADGEDGDGQSASPEDGPNAFNCDVTRPAGTCFERHVFGVTVARPGGGVAYRCGPCGPEDDFLDAMNRAFGGYGYARFRGPDPELARGSDDGYIAAVTKPDSERFADVVLNNDLLETMVPMLEVVRYAPHNRPGSQNIPTYSFGTPPRGRQLLQFAAVEVSSTYSIQCLLHYDEASNICGELPEELGSLTVSLTDGEGAPLAGGMFEVRADVDADGVAGLADELIGDGACVTGEDGVGTCAFDGLVPGAYLVSQTAAPAGYSAVSEPWISELAAGEARTVAFTNTTNLSVIQLDATDEDGAPVPGAGFAAYPDPDADGKIAPDAQPAATCVTGGDGTCAMTVPAGSYVLVQTSAPAGLNPIDPVAFTFASGGQTAAVTITNLPHDPATPPAPAASSAIAYTPIAPLRPTETVTGYTPPDHSAVAQPRVSVPEALGGTIVQVIRAPGDALRLLSRDPVQAVAWMTSLTVLALAALAIRRRHLLATLTATPALAFSPGGGAPSGPPASAPPPSAPTARPAAYAASATAVLERPPIAGAAPEADRTETVCVVAATRFRALASVIQQRLSGDTGCHLAVVVDTVDDLRAALAGCRPDVLVIDLALPTDDDSDLLGLLADLHPPARTVGLVRPHRSSRSVVGQAHRAGLAALLGTDEDLTNGQLAYAVRTVASGKLFYGPSIQAVLTEYWTDRPRKRGRKPEDGLTSRELEVARLAAEGLRRGEIAQRLYLSPGTVKRHLRTIRAKLGVTDPKDYGEIRRRLEEAGAVDNWDAPPAP